MRAANSRAVSYLRVGPARIDPIRRCCSCQPSESLLTIRRSATTLGYTPGGSGRQRRTEAYPESVTRPPSRANVMTMANLDMFLSFRIRTNAPMKGALTLSLVVCTGTENVGISRILVPPPRFPATAVAPCDEISLPLGRTSSCVSQDCERRIPREITHSMTLAVLLESKAPTIELPRGWRLRSLQGASAGRGAPGARAT